MPATVMTDPASGRTLSAVFARLDQEIGAGLPESPRRRTQTALRSLLAIHGLKAPNVPLDLAWFSRMYPLGGWDPILMPSITEKSYLDYRKRVRAVIARMTGETERREAIRRQVDEWDDVLAWLQTLPEFSGKNEKRLIPIASTLVRLARENNFRPDQATEAGVLQDLYDRATNKADRDSLVRATCRLAAAQSGADRSGADHLLPNPITKIATHRSKFRIPSHFDAEIKDFIEMAARKKYIKFRDYYTYIEENSRSMYRSSLRNLLHCLIVTGGLNPSANTFVGALEDKRAINAAISHMVDMRGPGESAATTTRRRVGVFPILFLRNGLACEHIREVAEEVRELLASGKRSGIESMPEKTKRFCRAVIEQPKLRADFLLSHVPPRRKAQEIMAAAQAAGRELTRSETDEVLRLGTVALFSAIENGGCPVRVESVLAMLYGCEGEWLVRAGRDCFKFNIPATATKNKKPINFRMKPGPEKYFETVQWYIDTVRPLFFSLGKNVVVLDSRFLIPKLSDPAHHMPYSTFKKWFSDAMRDVVRIPCIPHNFRHAQASILYHLHPDKLRMVARRLGDLEETVKAFYAWVHDEMDVETGQRLLVEAMSA